MKLFVLRHAKSSWEDPGLDDHERPLAPRGVRAVGLMAAHMRTAGVNPDVVLCSSSRRTCETLDGLGLGGEHLIEDELYSATVPEVIDRLRRLPAHVTSAMLVGHNPTVQMLVLRLAAPDGADGPGPERRAVERKFPTGALATLEFECGWDGLGADCARLVEFISPKDIKGTAGAAEEAQAPPASRAAH